VSSSDFNDLVKLLNLLFKGSEKGLKPWNEFFVDFNNDCNVHGCGEGIVGALTHVNVIIGMHKLASKGAS